MRFLLWREACSSANSRRSNGFDGTTTLAFIHPHYLALGMLFFVVLVMLDKLFGIQGRLGKVLVAYHAGLNVSVVMLLVRGVFQVLGTALPNGADAAISGIAGLGHLHLGRKPGAGALQGEEGRAGAVGGTPQFV